MKSEQVDSVLDKWLGHGEHCPGLRKELRKKLRSAKADHVSPVLDSFEYKPYESEISEYIEQQSIVTSEQAAKQQAFRLLKAEDEGRFRAWEVTYDWPPLFKRFVNYTAFGTLLWGEISHRLMFHLEHIEIQTDARRTQCRQSDSQIEYELELEEVGPDGDCQVKPHSFWRSPVARGIKNHFSRCGGSIFHEVILLSPDMLGELVCLRFEDCLTSMSVRGRALGGKSLQQESLLAGRGAGGTRLAPVSEPIPFDFNDNVFRFPLLPLTSLNSAVQRLGFKIISASAPTSTDVAGSADLSSRDITDKLAARISSIQEKMLEGLLDFDNESASDILRDPEPETLNNWLLGLTAKDREPDICQNTAYIVHYIGEGYYSPTGVSILLKGDSNNPTGRVQEGAILNLARRLRAARCGLLFFQASDTASNSATDEPAAGNPGSVVEMAFEEGLYAVLGFRGKINSQEATEFAVRFYENAAHTMFYWPLALHLTRTQLKGNHAAQQAVLLHRYAVTTQTGMGAQPTEVQVPRYLQSEEEAAHPSKFRNGN